MEIDKAKFIKDNAGLIMKFAKKYHFNTAKFSMDDLVQVGNKATVRALDSYDEKRGVKPQTYVGRAIDRDIREYVRSNKYDLYVSSDAQSKSWKRYQETGIKESYDKMTAVRLDWDWAKSSENRQNFSEILPSGAPPPDQKMMAIEQKDILLEEINRLSVREQRVIIGKHFDNTSFVDLGKELGVTKQRVKQIEQSAFGILKTRLSSRLGDFIAREDGLSRKSN